MPRVTVYVPTALHAQMVKHPEVNWSALAQERWAKELDLQVIPRQSATVKPRKPNAKRS